ncbi:Sarcoglycan complex subunit protein [Aphelenchoides avenae]|nr:Sarcoglycan complex subunit protein [Aphelenchus avenae]
MSRYATYDDGDPVWSHSGYDLRKSPSNYVAMQSPHNRFNNNNAPHQTTVIHSTAKPIAEADVYRVGIYGWRKRFLYGFILLLTLIIAVNLMLTVWIIMVLDLSSDGIGALKIDDEGIRVEGRSAFSNPVQFSQLSAGENEALTIDSSRGVFINAHNATGYPTASLNLNPDGKATAMCDRFEITDMDRKLLFFADSHEIGLKLENLRILDDGGSVFEGAIQTATIRPEPDTALSLESPTRNLNVEAGQDIELMSSAGEIQISSLLDINLASKQGEIRLDSGSIYMSGLERSHGQGVAQYQLCICHNGKLFMATERADCRTDRSICE